MHLIGFTGGYETYMHHTKKQLIVYYMTFYIYNFDDNYDIAVDICKHDVKDFNKLDLKAYSKILKK